MPGTVGGVNTPHSPLCPVGEYYTESMFNPAPCVAAAPLSQLSGRAFIQAIEVLHSPLAENAFDFDVITLESDADLPSVWHDEPSADIGRPTFTVTGLSALFLFHGIGNNAPCIPTFTWIAEGRYTYDVLWGLPVLRPSAAIADLHALADLREVSGVDERRIGELIDEILREGKATELELAHDIEQATLHAHDGFAELERYRSMVGAELSAAPSRIEHSELCCPGEASRRRWTPPTERGENDDMASSVFVPIGSFPR